MRSFCIPALLGRGALTHAGYLLSCTERMHVIDSIAQIWSREARWTYGAGLLLADACPDRHVLGLGFGGARPVIKPLAAMNERLDELDALETPNPGRGLGFAASWPRMDPRCSSWLATALPAPTAITSTWRTRAGAGDPRAGRVPGRRARGAVRVRPRHGPRDRARAHARVPDPPSTTSRSPADWATRRRRSPTAAETASSMTSCSGGPGRHHREAARACAGRSRSCGGAGDRDRARPVVDASLACAR